MLIRANRAGLHPGVEQRTRLHLRRAIYTIPTYIIFCVNRELYDARKTQTLGPCPLTRAQVEAPVRA